MYPQHDHATEKTIGNLAVLTVRGTKRKPQVTDYVDMTNGEIFSAETVRKMGVRSIRPDAMKRRWAKLRSLRPEPRTFAEFILRFRNSRCGFLIPLDDIVIWYAKYSEKETHHIRRYFPSLAKAGVLDDDLMLNEDFMINNPRAGKEEAKGDLFRAYNQFDLLMLKKHTKLN